MEKRKDGQIIAIAALAIAIIFMSVGFAVFAQNLQINGRAYVEKSVWDVGFDKSTFTNTGTIDAITSFDGTTSFQWKATLKKPGDYVEFTVDVKNAGTFDAKLKSITMNELPAAQAKYLNYYVSYDGGTYSNSITGLSKSLPSGETRQVKVKLVYFQPENSADLPTEQVTVDLTTSLGYEQA